MTFRKPTRSKDPHASYLDRTVWSKAQPSLFVKTPLRSVKEVWTRLGVRRFHPLRCHLSWVRWLRCHRTDPVSSKQDRERAVVSG